MIMYLYRAEVDRGDITYVKMVYAQNEEDARKKLIVWENMRGCITRIVCEPRGYTPTSSASFLEGVLQVDK